MDTIKLTIDNREVEVPRGTTILKAAQQMGINIPTLCNFELDGLALKNHPGGCRVCVVEVVGRRNLAPACITECMPDMVVKTNSLRVINARRTVLELMLSDHPNDCLQCAMNGKCELQSVAATMGIREIPYKGAQSNYPKTVSPSIVRDENKCIMCRRCESVCHEYQSVGAIGAVDRGFPAVVATAFGKDLVDTNCVFCGQCIAVCPTGALTEVDHTARILRDIANPDVKTCVQVAPAVRVALGEEFGMPAGSIVTGKIAAALKAIGFDYVFDTDWSADLTIMEEGTEAIGRFKALLSGDKNVKIPIMTSCCPAWVNFYEKFYPELREYPSTAKSPQQMFGATVKSYFAEKVGIPREKLISVSVMPCVAKKYECEREEFKVNGDPDVNYSITTRELARLIKICNIDFANLPEAEFDSPLGASTGAAVIFGATGGVMEAALRTAYEVITGKTLPKIDFEEVRGLDGIREATIPIPDVVDLKVAVVYGLKNARVIMEQIKAGNCPYHFVEVMACPGGCIDGAGQPYHHGDASIVKARHAAIYKADREMPLRKSHENPEIQAIYKEFYGQPCGEKSHHLLHTHYFDKKIKFDLEK
ncbi:MAG: iron hydrogenase small subunit [Bacteroidales bacterium]|nr:iron hydrogenase small subunit [Bacteroidales bacterium]